MPDDTKVMNRLDEFLEKQEVFHKNMKILLSALDAFMANENNSLGSANKNKLRQYRELVAKMTENPFPAKAEVKTLEGYRDDDAGPLKLDQILAEVEFDRPEFKAMLSAMDAFIAKFVEIQNVFTEITKLPASKKLLADALSAADVSGGNKITDVDAFLIRPAQHSTQYIGLLEAVKTEIEKGVARNNFDKGYYDQEKLQEKLNQFQAFTQEVDAKTQKAGREVSTYGSIIKRLSGVIERRKSLAKSSDAAKTLSGSRDTVSAKANPQKSKSDPLPTIPKSDSAPNAKTVTPQASSGDSQSNTGGPESDESPRSRRSLR